MHEKESARADRGSGAPTILIVEDDTGTVETFKQILEKNGYRVRVALDAEAGLLALEHATPSAIILDLHLPTANGVEFLRQLRMARPRIRIPVAMVTGDYFLEDSDAEELRRLNIQVYFKPLWEDDLLVLVGDLLASGPGGHARRRENHDT
jgi:two-component system CheB/CheR fusion protein